MEVRELLARNSKVAAPIAGVMAAIAVGFVVWQLFGSGPSTVAGNHAYYTVDDGKTWFADDITKVPPFDVNGKQAVACKVYSTQGQPKAVYLQKYSDQAKAAMSKAGDLAAGSASLTGNPMTAVLVKKPGDKDWITMADPRSQQIMNPGPNAEMVMP